MTVVTEEDTRMEEEVSLSINDINPSRYGCQVISGKDNIRKSK